MNVTLMAAAAKTQEGLTSTEAAVLIALIVLVGFVMWLFFRE